MLFRSALTGVAPGYQFLPPFAEDPLAVSYYKDIRPIFQQHCNGCHQPAKPTGGYVMTSHADLFKPGERGKAGVVAGKPTASYLVEQIKVHDNGQAEMPKGRDPLNLIQIKLIGDWIARGRRTTRPRVRRPSRSMPQIRRGTRPRRL